MTRPTYLVGFLKC